jgi:cytochrome c553
MTSRKLLSAVGITLVCLSSNVAVADSAATLAPPAKVVSTCQGCHGQGGDSKTTSDDIYLRPTKLAAVNGVRRVL